MDNVAAHRPGDPGTGQAGNQMEDAVKAAAAMAEETAKTGGLGQPGRPVNRRSPFFIGMTGAAGVLVTYGIAEAIIKAGISADPHRDGLLRGGGTGASRRLAHPSSRSRWAGVIIVILCVLGIAALFLALAIPRLAAEATTLAHQLPHYEQRLQNHNSELGKLNARYHLEQRLEKLVSGNGTSLAGGVLAAGKLVLSTVSSALVVAVLSIYFLAGLPQIKLFACRLVPSSRRPRVILIGDEILGRVGGYVLGNVLTSAIIGVGTGVWMVALGIPYPILLGLFVALIDLIPIIGSYIGGAAVTLLALTVSVPVAITTLAFYVCYKLAEDYLLVPRVMNRTVHVPATVTLIAVLIGGVLLGIVGALVAIPVAAAIRLLLSEIAFRRLDNS